MNTSREARADAAGSKWARSCLEVLKSAAQEPDSVRELGLKLSIDHNSIAPYCAALLQAGMLAKGAVRLNTETGKGARRLYCTDLGFDAIDGKVPPPTQNKNTFTKDAKGIAEAALEAWQHGFPLPEPLNGLVALYAAKKGVGVDS